MNHKHAEQWFDEWLPLAEAGQIEAQIAVGWEYFRGELTGRDLVAAERWFMAAELSRAEIGYFQLVRMLTLAGDEVRLTQIFASRQWRTGPMAYQHAQHLKRIGADKEAIASVLSIGAELGHLPSRIMLIQHEHPGWRRVFSLPREIPLVVRTLRIWWSDRDDERIAH